MQLGTELGLGSQATAVVEDIDRQMTAQEQFIRRIGCWKQVCAAAEGDASAITVPDHVPPELRHAAHSTITALAIRRIWASSRIVYALHPQMLAELADSSSEQLPGPIFGYLPHTDPLVSFPEPIPTTTPDGARGRILGFYVYGSAGRPRQLCSSHDEDRDRLGLMFVTALNDERGKRIDTDLTRVTIPVGDGQFTVDQAVDRTLAAFAVEPGMLMLSDRMRTWLTELVRTAVNVLLYLCSEEPDTLVVRPAGQRRSKGKSGKAGKPARMIKVGWRLGPAFHTARRVAANAPAETGTGRRRPNPHQRRGHFRTYWTGHGRTTPILRFIKPFWVNLDLVTDPTGGAAEHKVITVGPRQGEY
ncbi:hypothetical protein ACFQ68_11920 [Amycolatopsis japonica]|uniref:hypothetical protein n=1 Tax=Amycolatopsis japonica TaxID=208439 RepID=UPI00366CD7C7